MKGRLRSARTTGGTVMGLSGRGYEPIDVIGKGDYGLYVVLAWDDEERGILFVEAVSTDGISDTTWQANDAVLQEAVLQANRLGHKGETVCRMVRRHETAHSDVAQVGLRYREEQ